MEKRGSQEAKLVHKCAVYQNCTVRLGEGLQLSLSDRLGGYRPPRDKNHLRCVILIT